MTDGHSDIDNDAYRAGYQDARMKTLKEAIEEIRKWHDDRDWDKDLCNGIIANLQSLMEVDGVMPTPVQADSSVSAPEEEPLQTTRERVADAIAEAIGLDAYDCIRTWSAWSVGTMSQDDFVEVVRDQDRINEIADAAIAAMQQSTQASLKSGATQADPQAMNEHDTLKKQIVNVFPALNGGDSR